MQRNRVTTTPLPEVNEVKQINADLFEDGNCSDEEDFDLLIGFDPGKGKERLFSLSNSIRVKISPEQQRELSIEVGVNLSHQYPWRQMSKKFFTDHLSTDSFEMRTLKDKLKKVSDDQIMLIGFASQFSDETQDFFTIIADAETCKEACDLIKRLEAFERRKLQRDIVKFPRTYESMGSELEVDNYVKMRRDNLVDVELQSVYPMRYSNVNFGFRLSDDVRDGYSELIPSKKFTKANNVTRKMIDRSIQSGAVKINEQQQTDPTFPTNAWSQYIYDMDEEIKRTRQNAKKLEEPVEEKKSKPEKENKINYRGKKSKEEPPPPEPKVVEVPKISKQVENLLETLDFNQIDMYRNDYPFIAKSEILKYQTPFIEEICCFVDVEKCKGRNVTSIDWHPTLSGICVVAYGYDLRTKMMTESSNGADVDHVKRTVLDANPVLIWSLDDQLYPKLELQTMREISCVSWCPYDGNIIIGGCANGRIVIWDISKRLEKVEGDNKFAPPNEQRTRREIREFMNWSQIDESCKVVMPSALSNIDKSHEGAVTSIKWMASNYQCTSKGLLKSDRDSASEYRQFVTTSTDGNIMFWSLDWEASGNEAAKLVKKPTYKIELPDELKEETSPFKNIDLMFSYHFKFSLNKPIVSFTFNEGEFKYEPLSTLKNDPFQRVAYSVTKVKKASFNPSMVVGFSTGETVMCYWDGDFAQGAILDPKTIVIDNFANLHDEPVQIDRNPFVPEVLLTIGGSSFAVWREDCRSVPIICRRRKSRIMKCQWSFDRPSVLAMVFESGVLEIWDLNSRIDIPSLDVSLSGNFLSDIFQHKLALSNRLVAIADQNTNLRIFSIPSDFVEGSDDEVATFSKFINDEIDRKKNQENWKLEWFESNKDIIEAKYAADMEVTDEKEKKERIKREIEEKRRELAEAEAKKRAKKNARKLTYDLPERLEKKWNEQNYKRLLNIMMERKHVDRELLDKQTRILKERLTYNDEKQYAIKDSFSRVDNDLSTIRARLIPVEQHEVSREELVLDVVEKKTQTSFNYKSMEADALSSVECQPKMEPMSIFDILKRCKENRDLINMSLGGGLNAKFEKFRREKQLRMSRMSSVSNINRSLHSQTVDYRDNSTIETPSSMR